MAENSRLVTVFRKAVKQRTHEVERLMRKAARSARLRENALGSSQIDQ
jgi:hypothetical protein